MWRAVVEDLSAIPNVDLRTCLAERMRVNGSMSPAVDCFWSEQPAEWAAWWDEAIADADAVLVIAPETGGVLEKLVRDAGEKSLNCTPEAIALCCDKLRLAEHLIHHGIPTIPTQLVHWSHRLDLKHYPLVIKPRDGAGCDRTFLLRGGGGWHRAHRQYAGDHSAAIAQPHCAGRPVSVAGLFHPSGVQLFPVVEQDVGCGGAFGNQYFYRGGGVPARITPKQAAAVQELVRRTASTVPGLRGYVGFDVMLPRNHPDQPLVMEINPRLTTSYVGYRRICQDNLMAALLNNAAAPLVWTDRAVTFTKSGEVEVLDGG